MEIVQSTQNKKHHNLIINPQSTLSFLGLFKKLSCRNVWGPGRKKILFDSLIKSGYGHNRIGDGLEGSSSSRAKTVKNRENREKSMIYEKYM